MNEAIYEEHDHEECDCCQSGTCGLPEEGEFAWLSDYNFVNINPEGFQIHE